MFNLCKKAALALVLGSASLSAHAVETDITVWATVDPTLSLLKADGTPLSDVVELVYRAGSTANGAGLQPWSEQVRIFSNDITKDIAVRLGADPVLAPDVAAVGAVDIPLTVSLNGTALATTPKDFTAALLFPGSDLPGASMAIPLAIAQKTPGAIAFGGQYKGIVTVVMAQKP